MSLLTLADICSLSLYGPQKFSDQQNFLQAPSDQALDHLYWFWAWSDEIWQDGGRCQKWHL